MNPFARTVDERYATAVDSSHLEVDPDERCDVDLLIAAGWVRDGLGTSLYRLRVEWDAVQTEYRNARAVVHEAKAEIESFSKEGAKLWKKGRFDEAGELQRQAYATEEESTRAAQTEHTLLLTRLKTLRATREAVDRFAARLALRIWISPADFIVQRIAGRALEAWLDDNCTKCDGRGFNGGFGTPLVLCSGPDGCGGTGRRRLVLHHSDDGHAFGRLLLANLDRKADYVTGQMRRFLAQQRATDATAAALATRDLGAQLQRLRSAAAQED